WEKQQGFLMGRVITAPAEDPAGSGFLPRKLKRCPRKAKCFFRNGRLEYYQVTSQYIYFSNH
ncbi:hypothetical protein, partial [Virgibacillus halodenitrificans]|uniref:hypothetical protein n=1 Tax=Virgibacillus halodenitrificans TaxID=1482 RepID=UPI001C46162C